VIERYAEISAKMKAIADGDEAVEIEYEDVLWLCDTVVELHAEARQTKEWRHKYHDLRNRIRKAGVTL